MTKREPGKGKPSKRGRRRDLLLFQAVSPSCSLGHYSNAKTAKPAVQILEGEAGLYRCLPALGFIAGEGLFKAL